MGFFDRVGDFFNVAMDAANAAIPGGSAGPLDHETPTIGAAWAAADDPNSGVSKFLGDFDKNLGKYSGADKVVDFTTGVAGHAGEALSTAFSYAVGRPVSTLAQVDTEGTFGAYLSGTAWQRAWNRSENISAGQALSTDFSEATGLGPAFTQADDPYSNELAGQRKEYFDSWQGRMASGSIDLLLNLYADPTILAGKAAKAAEASRNIVKTGDRAGVLAHAIGEDPPRPIGSLAPPPITARQARQGDKAAKLITRIDQTPVGNIPAMPELARSADAGAYAQLFQAVKDAHPEDALERRRAIADVLGTAWGDQGSMDRMVARKDGLARQMEALSAAPAITKNSVGLDAATKAALMSGKQSVIDGLKDQIDDQIVRMQNVLGDGGTFGNKLEQPRVAGDIRGRMGYDRHLAGLGFSQTYLHTGSATPAVRVVSWGGRAATGRIPGSVHLKDSVNGYQDMNRVLGTMSNTAPEVKQGLLDSFVNATTPNHRMNVVKALNNQITIDAGLKYGLSEDDIAKVIKAGGDEMNFWRTAMGSRLYSAAEDATHVAMYDPEEDLIHGFAKPFMQSHIEDHHPVLDPAVMDKAMRKATGNRRLDKVGLPGAGNALETAGRVINDGVLRPLTSLWKDAALVRLAYPLRILTDTFARLGVHMGAAQYVMTRWTGLKGAGYYAITNEVGEKSLKNIFKEGDIKGALDKTFDLNVGHGLFKIPVEDREKIIRTVLAKNGGVADLGDELSSATLRRVRNGDWRIIPPPGVGAGRKEVTQYTEDYLRVINRQIKNSPSSMEFVKGRSIDEVAADVRAQLGAGGGPLANEYRTVGKNFPSIEEWLAHPLASVDHYLPIDDMRVKMLDRTVMARPTGAPSLLAHAKSMGKKSVTKAVKDDYRATYGSHAPKDVVGGLTKWDVDKFLTGKDAYVSAMPIHGEMYTQIEQSELRAGYQGLRKRWFTIMADMPETVMGRAPLFWDSYRKNIQHQIDALPEDYITPANADAIRKSAYRQAAKEMGRILYDASDASNMSHTMRYVSPFFTAWEDTMRKWSGLIYDNPSVLPRINQLAQSLNDAGVIRDANGNKVDSRGRSWDKNGHVITDPEYQAGGEFILLPKKLTSWIPGPLTEGQVKIRKDSINSVFQGDPFWLPGFGPMVQVPANKVVRDVFPKEVDDPIIKYLLPYGTTTESAVTQLLPKWVRSAKGIFGSGQQFANQYGVFLAEATVDARNNGTEVDLGKVKTRTRNYFILKAITDNASPVSVVPDPKYQLYIDKAHEYRNDKNRSDWIGDFMKDFPGYGEMGISLSANNTGITASNAAFDATKKYRKDIAADPEHGWMIVGPANAGGAFSGGVYDWQATHEAGFGKPFRGKQDPQSAIQSLQVQQGWSTWNSFMIQVNLALKDRGLISTQQSGAEDLQWAVGQAREALAKQNGAWGDAQASASHGGAGRLISTAQDFLTKHAEARSRPDMVALQQYMDFRVQVKQALSERSNKSLQYNPDLAYALEAGAKQLVENNIGFEAMFNRVLQYDDLSDIKIERQAA